MNIISIYKQSLNFKNGTYIELGANDGAFQSNTKWLEDDFNWSGILIEPSYVGYDACLKTRGNNKIFNCACVSFDYDENKIFGNFNGHAMSSVNGNRLNDSDLVQVEARTLQSIIDESGLDKIDFLSLDVEGYEFDVLKGLNLKRKQISFMLIEIYEKDKNNISNYLNSFDYECLENVTNFNHFNNPNWDGTHNDYFFGLKRT
jgi:FkbM family methyltransferase